MADDDIAWGVAFAVESSQLELQLWRLGFFSKLNELFQDVLNLFLEDVVLQEDDSLRLENFIDNDFASAGIR